MRISDWSSDVCSSDLIRSRLVPLFEAQTDVNKAMRDTVRIANEARTGLVPVADLYARLTLGGREFGMSQQRIARITEIAAKAAKLSGGAQVSQEHRKSRRMNSST